MNVSSGASFSLRLVACLMYTAAVAYLSLLPSSSFGKVSFPFSDKIAHFGVYGLYAAMLVWAAQATRGFPAFNFAAIGLGIVIYCAVFGGVMEILQQIAQPGDRERSLGDAAANALGALSLWAVVQFLPAPSGIAARRTRADADKSV